MRRIKQQETIKCEKFERAFRKINEINEKLKEYERERLALNESLDKLAEDARIFFQPFWGKHYQKRLFLPIYVEKNPKKT